MKKKILVLILILITFNNSFSMTEEELKEYKYIDFYDFVSSYNNIENYETKNKNFIKDIYNKKKIEISNMTNSYVYINPAEKYITYLEYKNSSKSIDIYQKPFLSNWFKLSNSKNEFDVETDNSETILANENIDLFFVSSMFSAKGKNYFIITQKAINDSMKKNLKNGDTIKVYIWNLGQYNRNTPIFLIIGYEKEKQNKDIKNELYIQTYLPKIKDDIFNRKYDEAKGKLEMLLKKYPDNQELKLNLCLTYNKTNQFSKSISCYQDIIKNDNKNYDAYYGISIVYYDNKSMDLKTKNKEIIENTTKTIEIIESITTKPTNSLAMILYNAYYLRALTKMSIKDKSYIDDLNIINKNQPELISNESLELYKYN